MKLKLYFLALTLAVFSWSCGKDEPPAIDVAIDFQPYLDRFIDEAAARGIEVDFSDTGLSIQFGTIDQSAAGVCSELGGSTFGSHRITIKKSYWDEIIDSERERLIFHELGHCELNRPHDNQIFSNGDWKSIMRGDPLPPGKTPLVNYSGSRKEYYIDELFNPSVSRPDWLNRSAFYNEVSQDQKTLLVEQTNVRDFAINTGLTGSGDFEIELTMQQTGGRGYAGFFWSGGGIMNSLHLYFYESTQLYISSGDLLYGHMHIIDFPVGIAFNENKLTIRKIGDLYYYFLNDQFIYWIDFQPLTSAKIESLVQPGVTADFKSVRVYAIDAG